MKHFVEGVDRGQSTLFPECLDNWIDENNPVRVIDTYVDRLDLGELRFEGVEPAETGRPAYHPSALLKLYAYGYLNRVQSSRRLEREAGRNVEVMWLLGRLVDLPPGVMPQSMLAEPRCLGTADLAVARRERRPDRPFWARWLPALAADSQESCAV